MLSGSPMWSVDRRDAIRRGDPIIIKKMFTEELDRQLIKHVKDNRVLYDYNDPKYMDFNTREVVWQKIGDEMKRPATDCKLRWINIRDVNRRILRKCLENPRISKTYKYENELSFMRPFYKDVLINETITIADSELYNENGYPDPDAVTDVDHQNQNIAVYHDGEDSDNNSCETKRKNKSTIGNKKKTLKKDVTNEHNPETSSAFVDTSQIQLDPSDPVDSFLISIGTVLRNLSSYQLNLAKTKIFAVAQEYELQSIVEKRK